MSIDDVQLPDLVPMLTPGKHRNPRKGACFVELASFLAGERWSDHPACTHALLAAVARLVNDNTSDAGRQRLAGLIPSVIGLTSHDLHVDARVALELATTALQVVAAEQRCAMAVCVLNPGVAARQMRGRHAWASTAYGRSAVDASRSSRVRRAWRYGWRPIVVW